MDKIQYVIQVVLQTGVFHRRSRNEVFGRLGGGQLVRGGMWIRTGRLLVETGVIYSPT